MVENRLSLKKVMALSIKLLFFTMLLIIMILFYQMNKHPDQPPSIFGFQGLTVLSNSMNPTFQTGDLVVVKSLAASEVQRDDIITYKATDTPYITHRVQDVVNEKEQPMFVTKGDNNNVADKEAVTSEHLVGKVLFHIPYVGYIANFIGSKNGFFLLVLLPLIGYISLEFYDRVNKRDDKKEKNIIIGGKTNEKE